MKSFSICSGWSPRTSSRKPGKTPSHPLSRPPKKVFHSFGEHRPLQTEQSPHYHKFHDPNNHYNLGNSNKQTSPNILNHAQANNATTSPLSDTCCKGPPQPHRIFTTTPNDVTPDNDKVDGADHDVADTNAENINSANTDAADAGVENSDAPDSKADYEADSDADYKVDNYNNADDNKTRSTNKFNVSEAFNSIADGFDPNPDGRGKKEISSSLADDIRPPDRHQRPTTTTSMIEMTMPK